MTLKELLILRDILSTDSISGTRLTVNDNFKKLVRSINAILNGMSGVSGLSGEPMVNITNAALPDDIVANSFATPLPEGGSYNFYVNSNGEVLAKAITTSSFAQTPRLVLDTNPLSAAVQAGEVRWTGSDFVGWDGTQWISLTAGAQGGEANTASNIGTGIGLFNAKVGIDLQFKSIVAGTGITFNTTTPGEVRIDNAGISGFSGYDGTSGFSGTNGDSGVSGFSGVGTSGFSGFSGISGYSGIGLSGFSGQSGTGGSGFSGFSGFTGISGQTGTSGRSGFSGGVGASGTSGYSGFSGFTGGPGDSGTSGSSGFSGFSADSGFSGFSGFKGDSGFGHSGFSGFTGFSGHNPVEQYPDFASFPTIGIVTAIYFDEAEDQFYLWNPSPGVYVRIAESGYSGVSGFSGYSSDSGFSGVSGFSGFSSDSGFSGVSGFTGASGVSGFSGYSGVSGFSGYTGISGFTGESGVSGYSGYSGVSGFSAYSGVSGFSGYTGVSGYSGYTGVSGYSGIPSTAQPDTYANWEVKRLAGTLPAGQWIEVTDIPSQPDTTIILYCPSATQIGMGGKGVFLNADWQNAGSYTGVTGLTGVGPLANLGQWHTGLAYRTITYSGLTGGFFAVGDTITDTVTGGTAVVITDNASSVMTVYVTSSGVSIIAPNAFNNGLGVSATVTTASDSIVTSGNIAIYDCLHYQITDISALNGTNPSINTAAYTLLPKSLPNMGYITETDDIEFDFSNDWLQRRIDKRGTDYFYSKFAHDYYFNTSPAVTAINYYQWGRDAWFSNVINNGEINQPNALGAIYGNNLSVWSSISGNTFGSSSAAIYDNFLTREANIYGNTLGGTSEIFKNAMFDGSVIDTNVMSGSSRIFANILKAGSIFNNTITTANIRNCEMRSTVLQNNVLSSGAHFTKNECFNMNFEDNTMNATVQNNVMKASLTDKTFSGTFQNNTIGNGTALTVTETVPATSGKTHGPGFSNMERTVSITGLTTLALASLEKVGIYNLTSGNAAETLSAITGFSTAFPLTLRPGTALDVTADFTAVGSLASNGQLVGPVTATVLYGATYDQVTLEAATMGAYSVLKQIDSNSNI